MYAGKEAVALCKSAGLTDEILRLKREIGDSAERSWRQLKDL